MVTACTFGGQFGKEGTLDALRTAATQCRKSNLTVLNSYVFGETRNTLRIGTLCSCHNCRMVLLSLAHLYILFQYNSCIVFCLIHTCYLLKKSSSTFLFTLSKNKLPDALILHKLSWSNKRKKECAKTRLNSEQHYNIFGRT